MHGQWVPRSYAVHIVQAERHIGAETGDVETLASVAKEPDCMVPRVLGREGLRENTCRHALRVTVFDMVDVALQAIMPPPDVDAMRTLRAPQIRESACLNDAVGRGVVFRQR